MRYYDHFSPDFVYLLSMLINQYIPIYITNLTQNCSTVRWDAVREIEILEKDYVLGV